MSGGAYRCQVVFAKRSHFLCFGGFQNKRVRFGENMFDFGGNGSVTKVNVTTVSRL